MKTARGKNILRTIRSGLNRFIAILFIVALGAGFEAGLAATSPDMYDTADMYMDRNDMYDIDVKGSMGLTESDISEIEKIDGVSTVQPANAVDMVLLGSNENSYTSRIFAFLDENGNTKLNGFELKEGRLPENNTECVIQKNAGRYADDTINIGDKLYISEENTNYDDLKGMTSSNELTIVGYAEAPMCIAIYAEASSVGSGSVSMEIYTMEDFFSMDYYTDAYITVAGAKELETFEDDYKDLIKEPVKQIEELAKSQAHLRSDQIKEDANEKLEQMEDLLDTSKLLAAFGLPFPETGGITSIEELEEKIDDVRQQIDEMEDAVWIVLDRYDSYGFSTYKSNIAKVGALSKIFPVFFFLVALLVALTTMTRLVEENRGQIGTLKALGFSNAQILGEYIFYALLFSVLGCALGLTVGFKLFPSVICSAYQMMYVIPDIVTPFRLSIAAWVAPITIGSILIATIWASWNEFRAVPAVIMRPKAPAAGKRIWLEHITFIWNRLNFTKKVTMRNIFRYKKRFFMTIVGVAGCSALLLTGFGLRDSISDIVDKQYGEINAYDFVVVTDDAEAAKNNELGKILNNKKLISDWMSYCEESIHLDKGEDSEKITVVVPDEYERSGDFISLRDRKKGTVYNITDDYVVITEKIAESLNIKVGDEIVLENEDGRKGNITVSAICENYIGSYAYISKESYSRLFGSEPEMTMIMSYWTDEENSEEVTRTLLEDENVIYVNSSQTLKKSFSDSIKSINGVIVVLILSAGLLCIIVLYNLTNVNICERKKELATTRVLGFYKRETQNYIFRETNILSFFGGFIGLFLGLWLHSFVIRTVEVEMVMFGRQVYFTSFLYAMAITVIFTLLVNLVLRRKINKIDMVEAMKANE